MDHSKRTFSSTDDAFMSEVDRGWDDVPAPVTAKAAPPKRRETDRHINISDLFGALGDTPYARQMRERGPKKPIARVPFTLDANPRKTADGSTEYRVFPNEEETPFLLTVRKGLHRRDENRDEAAE